jgi:hypothetical protein
MTDSHDRESTPDTMILPLLGWFLYPLDPFEYPFNTNCTPCGASGASGAYRPDVMHRMHRLHRFGGGSGGVPGVTPP